MTASSTPAIPAEATTLAGPQQMLVQTEQSLLGALMACATGATVDEAAGILGEDAGVFWHPPHQLIYAAILYLRRGGQPTNPTAVTKRLVDIDHIGRVGGVPYLADCYDHPGAVVPSAGYYARIIRDHALLRRLSAAATRIQQLTTTTPTEQAVEAVEQARRLLAEVDVVFGRGDTLRSWGEVSPLVLDEVEQAEERGRDGVVGLPTGLGDLDALLGGLKPGQLIVVGARPGCGKTALLLQILTHAAVRLRRPVALFSAEMSATELGLRVASAGAGIPMEALRAGRLGDGEWARLARFVGETGDAPLLIDDTPHLTLGHVRSAVRRVVDRDGPLACVAVDYLQLMTPVAVAGRRPESRQQEVADLSRGLKLLAKEIGCPIIAACQLNRSPDHRADKRPQLSDLRESGAIEQDADVVLLLHRPDLYDPESERSGEADLIVAKHRNGPTDTITVAAQLHLARFRDLALFGG